MNKKNVHTEHCCFVHGCKYGDDDCPVEGGVQIQSFKCEACAWNEDEREREEKAGKPPSFENLINQHGPDAVRHLTGDLSRRCWIVYDPDYLNEGAKFAHGTTEQEARHDAARQWSYEGSEFESLHAVEITDTTLTDLLIDLAPRIERFEEPEPHTHYVARLQVTHKADAVDIICECGETVMIGTWYTALPPGWFNGSASETLDAARALARAMVGVRCSEIVSGAISPMETVTSSAEDAALLKRLASAMFSNSAWVEQNLTDEEYRRAKSLLGKK